MKKTSSCSSATNDHIFIIKVLVHQEVELKIDFSTIVTLALLSHQVYLPDVTDVEFILWKFVNSNGRE